MAEPVLNLSGHQLELICTDKDIREIFFSTLSLILEENTVIAPIYIGRRCRPTKSEGYVNNHTPRLIKAGLLKKRPSGYRRLNTWTAPPLEE